MEPTKRELRALTDWELNELCGTLYWLWRTTPNRTVEEARAAKRWARAADEVLRRERRRLRIKGKLMRADDVWSDF